MRKQQHNITSKLLTVLFIILALPVTIFFMVQHARPVQSAVSLIHYTVYEGSLTSGWKAQSWASEINLANTSPAYSGSRSISFTPTRRGAGLYLYTSRAVDTRLYSFFHFATQASQAGQDYNLTLYGGTDNMLSKVRLVNSVPGTWNVYTIPLSKLRANATHIGGIALQSRTRSHGTLYIDSIGFIGLVSSPTPLPFLLLQHPQQPFLLLQHRQLLSLLLHHPQPPFLLLQHRQLLSLLLHHPQPPFLLLLLLHPLQPS